MTDSPVDLEELLAALAKNGEEANVSLSLFRGLL